MRFYIMLIAELSCWLYRFLILTVLTLFMYDIIYAITYHRHCIFYEFNDDIFTLLNVIISFIFHIQKVPNYLWQGGIQIQCIKPIIVYNLQFKYKIRHVIIAEKRHGYIRNKVVMCGILLFIENWKISDIMICLHIGT